MIPMESQLVSRRALLAAHGTQRRTLAIFQGVTQEGWRIAPAYEEALGGSIDSTVTPDDWIARLAARDDRRRKAPTHHRQFSNSIRGHPDHWRHPVWEDGGQRLHIAGQVPDGFHQFADRGLIGWIGEMQDDVPAAVSAFVSREGGLILIEALVQKIDDVACGWLIADRKRRAVSVQGDWGRHR